MADASAKDVGSMSLVSIQGPAATKVFISYSRRDSDFVNWLAGVLRAHSVEAIVDKSYIEDLVDWWDRLKQLIAKADTVVFVVSKNSVASEICHREVAYAEHLNKRLAPIVIDEPDHNLIPQSLSRLNFIFFRQSEAHDASARALVIAIQTNIEWVREHTRLAELARRWRASGEPTDLLLQGGQIALAERWRKTQPPHAPNPTEAHFALIAASTSYARNLAVEAGRTRRARRIAAALAVFLIGALGLGVYQSWLDRQAEIRADQALARARSIMNSGGAEARIAAMESVSTMGSARAERAAPEITLALGATEPEVRARALALAVSLDTAATLNAVAVTAREGPVPISLQAVEALTEFKRSDVFDTLLALATHDDPRRAGRAKALLSSAYRDRLIAATLTTAREGRDVVAANALLDVVMWLDDPGAIAAITAMASFSGDYRLYVAQQNPRSRALRLLYGRLNPAIEDAIAQRMKKDDISAEERVACALALLGRRTDAAVAVLETISKTEPDKVFAFASILLEDHRELAERLLVQAFLTGETVGLAHSVAAQIIGSGQIEVPIELLRSKVTSTKAGAEYVAALIELGRRAPEEMRTHLAVASIPPAAANGVLVRSSRPQDRREAVLAWAERLKSGADKLSDPFHWSAFADINESLIATISPGDLPLDALAELLNSNAPDVAWRAAIALSHSPLAEQAALIVERLYRDKKISSAFFYLLLEQSDLSNKRASDTMLTLDKELSAPFEGNDYSQRTWNVAALTRILMSTSERVNALNCYVRWTDRDPMLKGRYNADFGDPVGILNRLSPESQRRRLLSFGAWFVTNNFEALIHFWLLDRESWTSCTN